MTEVTFSLPKEVQAGEAALCGDFNNWDPTGTRMSKLPDGSFAIAIDLADGEYRYRFLLDGDVWENDWDADGYVANPYGGEDSIIKVNAATV